MYFRIYGPEDWPSTPRSCPTSRPWAKDRPCSTPGEGVPAVTRVGSMAHTAYGDLLRPASESGPAGRRAAHLRSEAGQGHGRVLPVTLPRGASDQRKRAEAGHQCPSPLRDPSREGLRDPSRGDQGTPGGTHPGTSGVSVIAPEWFESWPELPIRLSAAVTSRLAGSDAGVLTVASIDQRATTPGASYAPGVVGRTGLPDSAAGLRTMANPRVLG